MTNTTSSMIFCGLVAGYQGENNVATPENAAEAVSAALMELGVETDVTPAVCVYHMDWGCPKGGEPVGAFQLTGSAQEILATADALRQSLNQSTLSVGLEGHGAETLGFGALASGSLQEIAALWQEAAAEEFAQTGTYVSCGMTLSENDEVFISAEANPEFVKDLEAWKQSINRITAKTKVMEMWFDKIGFNYLTK